MKSEQAPVVDEESLVIDIDQVMDALRRRFKLILASFLAGIVGASVFTFTLYQEKFRSHATLLFNPVELPSVVSNIDTVNRFFKTQGLEVSPYRNQEELLRSKFLAQQVLDALKAKNIRISAKTAEELSEKVLSAEHIPSTDFIRLSAVAETAEKARQINQVYTEQYLSFMKDEISLKPLTQQEKLFSEQAVEAEKHLVALGNKIQAYQEQYGILDLSIESQSKVNQLEDLAVNAKQTEALLAEKRASALQVRRQLSLKNRDVSTALYAVAQGQDNLLTDLQEKLNEAQKEYDVKALTYSPTNPEMRDLEEKIAVLKAQMTDQQILTVGQPLLPRGQMIKDQVRADLVKQLANSESDSYALASKLSTIRRQYGDLKTQLSSLPVQQLEYARLLLEKKNRENVLIKLREKLSEVQIQKAAVQEKLVVIDEPNKPVKAVFPGRLHIIFLAGFLGAALSAVAVTGHALINHREVRPEVIEKVIGLPVLSIIPWLSQDRWQQNRKRGFLEVTASSTDPGLLKSYQDLALNLKAQRNQLSKNTLTVCSLSHRAGSSILLPNLAFCIAQSGERVLLVDANLRKPRLHESFGHSLNYEKGLPEIINSISEALYRNNFVQPADLLPIAEAAILPSGVHPQLFYVNAGLALENTFEFLNSRGFATLIQALKSGYDWVLLDAPPFLAQPDAGVLLGFTDGLLLLVEKDACEGQIHAVKRKVERLNSTVVGAVLRGSQNQG